MGCGSSTTNSTVNPGNRRPQTNTNNNVNTSATTTNNSNNRTAQSTAVPALVSRPLSKSKPYRHGASITLGEIQTQRAEYWSTRIEGNPHMWQAIKSSAEALLTDDEGLANAILEASNITTPNGNLEVCYDERGVQYKVPMYCYCNPMELQTNNNNTTKSSNKEGSSERTSVLSGELVKLRVRINPGDHNLTVEADVALTILELKQMIAHKAAESENKFMPKFDADRERIIFMGREMMNKTKVGEAGFDDAKVVQVFLRPAAK